ncbi:4'-phosphopantetheinyl transferase family protein [Streptomyces sp. G5(2025)]|uniref:4'-phosphopantetheinyl transferase family protein n=1 Tax=Streptomyces sp. G5(2025) TaxID=3406628 RepID=UPI003C1337DA
MRTLSALLEGTLDGVAVVETFSDRAVRLFPEEAARMVGAPDARRREYATVRWCARTALRRLGGPEAPLVPANGGAPSWPEGFVGSMTHCDGYRAAAVASARVFVGLGIDAEPHGPLPPRVLSRICSEPERRDLDRLTSTHPDTAWDRLLFSAKESVYKAWFPLTGQWLDFLHCVISLDPHTRTFTAALAPKSTNLPSHRTPRVLRGRWQRTEDYLATAVLMPSASAASVTRDFCGVTE